MNTDPDQNQDEENQKFYNNRGEIEAGGDENLSFFYHGLTDLWRLTRNCTDVREYKQDYSTAE